MQSFNLRKLISRYRPKAKIPNLLYQSIVVFVCIGVFVIGLQGLGLLDGAERFAFDQRVQLFRKNKPLPEKIALILIDESSLSAMEPIAGRWPWARQVHADVIDFLSVCGARAILFDVLFTEISQGMINEDVFSDRRLVESTKDAGTVVNACQLVKDPAYWYEDHHWRHAREWPALQGYDMDRPSFPENTFYNRGYWPFASLALASRGIGVTTFEPDEDGVYRHAELLFAMEDRWLPSLSISALLMPDQKASLKIKAREIRLKSRFHDLTIPLDDHGRFPVNLYGRYAAYSYSGIYLSAMRLKSGQLQQLPVQPYEFKDKIVFIGASAAGVEDLKTTSLGMLTPGVLLHASVYANMISDDYLHMVPGYVDAAIVLLLMAVTVGGIFFSKKLKRQILYVVGVLVFFSALNLLLFSRNWVLAFTPAITAIMGVYVMGFTWIGFSAGREKRKIKNILGQYVSPAVLTTVLNDPKKALNNAEVGRRETLSMLFSDIRDFTSISETYAVEQVVALLNRYLEAMVDIIFDHRGTLDKFIGDAIMAFWGAPVADKDHAFQAVSSAIFMQQALVCLNKANQPLGLPCLKTGAGIHTDEVLLGNIGSQKKLDYTVIGDGVNLTSRLEGLTKYYHCPILITQDTYDAVHDRICCRMVDLVKVKGRQACIHIFEPLAHVSDASERDRSVAELSFRAFEMYRQRRFDHAATCYERILALRPKDGLSHLFKNRCYEYGRNRPDERWQGECVFQNK